MTKSVQAPQAVGDALDVERWLDEGGSLSRPVGQLTTSGTLIAPAESLALAARPASRPAASRPAYACPDCGHLLRVSGLGRHRVYFELGDERSGGRHRVYFELGDERSEDPVMNRVCSACGHGLHGKNPR